jgi:ribosome-associated protein
MQRPENPFLSEPKPTVPESEMGITFVRSSGPGGQKVNKTSSKAMVRWNVDRSASFSDEEKTRIHERLQHRLTNDGDLIVTCMQERSQLQNRIYAVRTLQELVSSALEEEKERKPTKPSKAAKRQRMDDKRKTAEKKQSRRGFDE